MACTYTYKGKTFNSELELDDFILEKMPFESKFGDLVFSMSEELLNVGSLLDTISKDADTLKGKMREAYEKGNIIYDEDGEIALEEPPYIGVNKFLSGLKNSEGKLLFPLFRENEYWSRRFAQWKLGLFNDAEIEEFGFDKDNLPKITDAAQWDSLKNLMKNKWEILAKSGSAIHNVLRILFSKTKEKYNFSLEDSELIKIIDSKLDRKNKKYIKGDTILQAIAYARKLHSDIEYKYGKGCMYYPEFAISLETNVLESGKSTKLFGIIDLLIIDKTGKPHILDYKTSIRDYTDFYLAKKGSYSYLLATYQRMLLKYGVNTYQGDLIVAPIQISNFRKDGSSYTYDGILPNSMISLNETLLSSKVWDNIDEFMHVPFKLSITTKDAVSTTTDMISNWFPFYSSTVKITREYVIERLKKLNKLTKNENGEFVYNRGGKEEPIVSTSETEFIDKVVLYEQSLPPKRLYLTGLLKTALTLAMEHGIENAEFPSPIITESDGSVTYLKDILSPYCNDNWEIMDNSLLELYGILTLKTKHLPNRIDFVRVSTNNLYRDYRQNYNNKDKEKNKFKERRGLTGTYEADVVQKSKAGSLIAEAVLGNVELMETMLLINQMRGIEGYTVGNVLVVNPIYANGLGLSNELLLYCWKELNKHHAVKNDLISNGTIKFADKYTLARDKFNFIMREGAKKDWKEGFLLFGKLRGCQNILDENIDSSLEEKKEALIKLLNTLTSLTKKLDKVYNTEADILSKEVSLHNSILYAISQLNGVNFVLQLKDHDAFIENLAIWKYGVSGTYIDNPGNMDSDTLNLVARLVFEAYQNTRDELLRDKVTIQKLIGNLKRESLFGYIKENTTGNQVDLYKDMFQPYTKGGDFLFKNPDQLTGAKKEFFEYALYRINKNRYNKTDEELKRMRDNNDIEYYRVPLATGSDDSIASTNGLLSLLRAKLNYLNPKKALQRAREKVEGVFNAEDSIELQQKSLLLYKMTNMFDKGENMDKRLDIINKKGVDYFEHNLETLLYKHLFAYSVKNNVNSVFPMIKASMVHIATEGAILNKHFGKDTHYLENYIRNKIFNLVIIDPKFLNVSKYLNGLKQAASTLTLAFSPVQAFYQTLLSLWVDISLIIRKPDGTNAFTFNNFKNAVKIVYSDLTHYSDKPTTCSSLNELYGLNDMDMNTYTERISTAKRGIWDFNNFAFKMASRPDYYSRMSIFLSKMMGDGCYEAHHLNENGELIYDWKKDKRFEAFANNRYLDPKYNEQKALYYLVATQFVREHSKVKLPNGNVVEFKLNMKEPMPLPRAYTTKEAESIKSLSDDIYGYYSHEKKSLIMSTMLGGMWLQFKTYWSGKKNLYLKPGGVKLQGKWEQKEENGQKYYYQVDLDGNIKFDEPPTTQETSAPVMIWKGQWQEGIMLTLADIAKNSWNAGLFDKNGIHLSALKESWNSKWNNEDSNLQLAYRNNIKQGAYDLLMFIIGGCIISALMGDWLKDLKKDNVKNRDVAKGLGVTAANVAVMSVRNSFFDFNAWDSIGGALLSWTPFSFEWGARTFKNISKVAMGDEDFWDGVVNSSSALKQVKPLMDTVKPDMFRTEREGGTFGKKEQ